MKEIIVDGRTSLGIEFGSTRIKAILIDPDHAPVAAGNYDWENRLEDGKWTYSLNDIWQGLAGCYAALKADVKEKYGVSITKVGSIGISGMMHGYLALDQDGALLTPFRTWRNTTTARAASALTKELGFNIPQRWSIAHLYQAILDGEAHVSRIHHLCTLATYVHYMLTGQRAIGLGEASGMFPIDSGDFNAEMLKKFAALVDERGFSWNIRDILPKVLSAGEEAGALTEAGAKLLDPSGELQSGIPFCPPEGDAGTGMVATNSVAERTGNVSAGTSIFAMLVLEKELSRVYEEIDMVTTPTGKPVAMVHCNNCSSDLDAWVKLFGEAIEAAGAKLSKTELYALLYGKALEGEADGLLAYNYYSGEPITGFEEGRPLFTRLPDSNMHLANFMRAMMFSALATLKIGMDILFDKEQVTLDKLLGHGGFFKTEGVGQRMMAAAVNVPVAVMSSAGEGGAWGISILAAYALNREKGETLEDYLEKRVFADAKGDVIAPDHQDVQGFKRFMDMYQKGLNIEKEAISSLQ